MPEVRIDMPKPSLIEKNGRFYARWTHDDELMRSRNRSILERPERIVSVDDAFIDALRSDEAEVKWSARAELKDLASRITAWRLDPSVDPASCGDVAFRISPPEAGSIKCVRRDVPGEGTWRLDALLRRRTEKSLRALGAACRVYSPLRGMTGNSMELEQSEVEAFLRIGVPALKASGYSLELPEDLAAEVVAEAEMVSAEKKSGAAAAKKNVKAKITVRVAGE